MKKNVLCLFFLLIFRPTFLSAQEEGELQAIVADKQLKLDNFTTQKLENERRKYSFNIWHFFCWGRHG